MDFSGSCALIVLSTHSEECLTYRLPPLKQRTEGGKKNVFAASNFRPRLFFCPAAKHVLPHYVLVCEAKAADTDPGVISLTRHCGEQTRRDHPTLRSISLSQGNSFSPHHLWLKAAYRLGMRVSNIFDCAHTHAQG